MVTRPAVKLRYPGLLREPLPSGAVRWRVRPEGETSRRIRIHCGPDHEDFQRQYLAARRGETPHPGREEPSDPDRKKNERELERSPRAVLPNF